MPSGALSAIPCGGRGWHRCEVELWASGRLQTGAGGMPFTLANFGRVRWLAAAGSVSSLEEILGFDDLVEITLIDQILRRTFAHDEHRLQGFICGERLQQLDLAFHADDVADFQGVLQAQVFEGASHPGMQGAAA